MYLNLLPFQKSNTPFLVVYRLLDDSIQNWAPHSISTSVLFGLRY